MNSQRVVSSVLTRCLSQGAHFKVLQSPHGTPHFYRIAEVYFPSMEALQRCAASAGAQETLANAAKISSGGPPVIMIAEEDTFTF